MAPGKERNEFHFRFLICGLFHLIVRCFSFKTDILLLSLLRSLFFFIIIETIIDLYQEKTGN